MAHTSHRSAAEQDKMALISGVELFSTLLDDDLAYIASRTGYRAVETNTVIFPAGGRANQFFIVKSGSVSITAASPSGPQVLARYVQGDVFGDFHFVINGQYNATALTLEPTELMVFPEDGIAFERLSDEKPDTASRILLRSITMIASRLRSTNRLISENTPWIRELRKQIFTDPSTGLWNKTFMDSELPPLLSGTVAAIMIKPDRFKELNDSLGHAEGDVILGKMAALLMDEARNAGRGWAIRLRSNEMCLIMNGSSTAEGRNIAVRIEQALSALIPPGSIDAETGKTFRLTASIAVGFWPDDCESWTQLAERTNQAMQDVWKSGGAKIVLIREAAVEKN